MGQINNTKVLAWFGTTTSGCSSSLIKDLTDIDITYRVGQGGIENSNPESAGYGLTYGTFECGTANLIYSNEVNYSIDNVVASDLDTFAGAVALSFPEEFDLAGSGAGTGTYTLTSTFKNNRPTFKNGDWWSWFDGSSWVVSTPSLTTDGTHFLNNSGMPNAGPYGSLLVVGEACYNVSEFTGGVASANGIYCKAGFANGKPAHTHESGNWFIYWDGQTWILSDVAYGKSGEWIANGSGSEPLNFNGASSTGFSGQTGDVDSTSIPGGALYTEDLASVLAVEDLSAVVTTEA